MKTVKYILAITAIMMTMACRSVQTLVDEGDYDSAIVLATKKMRGNKVKKTKHIKALEKAFANINLNDIEEVEFLKERNDLFAWERVLTIAERIDYRQSLVAPYLPLRSKDGYSGRFDFINAHEMISDASERIKDLSYERGTALLSIAQRDDRLNAKAREAYYAFTRVLDFDDRYKNVFSLMEEARTIGKEHVLVETFFDTDLFVPHDISRFLEGVSYVPHGDEWIEYYSNPNARSEYDFIAQLYIGDIILSPEMEKVRRFTEEKEVRDGDEYVLDERGNVKKDTLGNDITRPKYTTVTARIREITRTKSLELRGEISLTEVKDGQKYSRPVNADAYFADGACIVRGDRRALTNKTKKRVKDYPLEFPSDVDMLFDTMDEVKTIFEDEIHKMISRISV